MDDNKMIPSKAQAMKRKAYKKERDIIKIMEARDTLRAKLQELEERDDYFETDEKKGIRMLEKMDKITRKIQKFEEFLNQKNAFEDAVPSDEILPKFPTIVVIETGIQPLNDLITQFINKPCVQNSLRVWDNYTRLQVKDIEAMLSDESVINCPKAKVVIPVDPINLEKFIIDVTDNVNRKISHVCNQFNFEDIDLRYETGDDPPEGHPPSLEQRDANRLKLDFDRVKKELNDLPLESGDLDTTEGIELTDEDVKNSNDEYADDDEVIVVEEIAGPSTIAENNTDRDSSDESSCDEAEIETAAGQVDENEPAENEDDQYPPIKKSKMEDGSAHKLEELTIIEQGTSQINDEASPSKVETKDSLNGDASANSELLIPDEIVLSSDEEMESVIENRPELDESKQSEEDDIICLD
uniref:Uncharacterized protein n=1 Tax=Acrobeloides nanus TaxID=290746 RepID=A0A914DUZ3_9BILA